MPARLPAVAGQFYPAETGMLRSQLEGFLAQARIFYPFEVKDRSKKPKILISPHAGTVFSGSVAGWGYKQLVGRNYKRVILLGASHHMWFDTVVVDAHQAWQTPLGQVAVDKEVISQLIQASSTFTLDSAPHIPEHSLEMQLVFLQRVLKKPFTLVPLLVSKVGDALLVSAADALADLLNDPETLLVISTDLSHYPPYKVANAVDSVTLEAVLGGKAGELEVALAELSRLNLPVDTFACGKEAVKLGLKAAERLGLTDWRYLRYANSHDAGGGPDSVVGYVSLAAHSGKLSWQVEALQLARRSLEFYLRTGQRLEVKAKTQKLKEAGGTFVTLNKRSSLRGCIGLVESKQPRCLGILENAISAGVDDPRFPAVTLAELAELEFEVSLLTQPKLIDDWRKIKLGRDGVVIEYRGKRGVFLPQVGRERDWSLKEFLSVLCSQKVEADPDCFRKKEAKIYTFQVEEARES